MIDIMYFIKRQTNHNSRGSTNNSNQKANEFGKGPGVMRDDRYSLATGAAAAHRLWILHRIYGPGAQRVLVQAGIRPGMSVADIGCGVGMVTNMLSKLVGTKGNVVGVDASKDQIEQARKLLPSEASNISFVVASALSTGLPADSFDLVYCRFLLIHLSDPQQALVEMRRILKPNGILVCEDGDLTSAGSQPPSKLNAFADLFGRLGPVKGVDYTLGKDLFHMFISAGFNKPEITFNQPVIARGQEKRLLELSVAEAKQSFVGADLITAEELDRTVAEMQSLADDETVLAVMPRMSQVWARKTIASSEKVAA
ncbi:MAG TPA: methyltransferase domain-containing protein [Blastocatellia bacterium]|nr:methyltransferase domain-containing protein [Blastocatellia bacterium]